VDVYRRSLILKKSAAITAWLFAGIMLSFAAGCAKPDWSFGSGGKYQEADIELLRGKQANLDKAIDALQIVVQKDPTYRDSLVLLGKAYYRKGRYYDSYNITQRAVAVNNKDEIAWLVYGLSQLRVGQNEKGLETVKGGLTLLAKVMTREYRGYDNWDPRGIVRNTLNRAIFQALKGLEERENLIQINELLIARIDEEEWFQRHGKNMDRLQTPD
jgi:tetratricopeptide (TPR) repeat protein